jgi:3-hydroxybutyryl-CoA dehydratase
MMYLNGRLSPHTVLEGSMTVTETHLVLGAGLIGGFHPVHVDEQYAVAAGLRGRVLHGALTAAVMSAVIGRNLPTKGWTIVEQSTRFRAPVYCGDTLHTRWTAMQEPEVLSGGRILFTLKGECRCQGDTVVADGTVKLVLREC